MTTIIEKVKKDLLLSRKEKNKIKIGILSALISEITSVGKNNGNRTTNDEEAIKVINKFYKNLNELFTAYSGISLEEGKDKKGDNEFNKMLFEASIYKSYLPQLMSEEELTRVIGMFLQTENKPNVSNIMKYLKEKVPNQYDGKMASNLAKEICNG